MISMVVENAHKAGIWAGICGELGADQTLTKEGSLLNYFQLFSAEKSDILIILRNLQERFG